MKRDRLKSTKRTENSSTGWCNRHLPTLDKSGKATLKSTFGAKKGFSQTTKRKEWCSGWKNNTNKLYSRESTKQFHMPRLTKMRMTAVSTGWTSTIKANRTSRWRIMLKWSRMINIMTISILPSIQMGSNWEILTIMRAQLRQETLSALRILRLWVLLDLLIRLDS